MGDVRCPMCGKPNPDDLEVCQYCQARLKPLTAPLGEPIHPGEEPTPRSTSELEPVLPEWLRKARHPEDETETPEDALDLPFRESPSPSAERQSGKEEPGDWLSGLIARDAQEDEEEIPDWLANLSGRGPVSTEETAHLPPQQGFQPSGTGAETPTPVASSGAEDELPAWLSDLKEDADEEVLPLAEDDLSGQPALGSAGETDWMTSLKAEAALSDLEPDQAAETALPDWLARLDTPQETSLESSASEPPLPSEGELPDWLTGLSAAGDSAAPSAPKEEGLPDWLAGPGETSASEPPLAGDLSDWFAAVEEKSEEPSSPAAPEGGNLPDWLTAAMEETSQAETPTEQPPLPAELPDWISGLKPEAEIAAAQEQPSAFESQEMPDWLAGFSPEVAAAPAEQEQAQAEAEPQEIPDWLASLPGAESLAGASLPPFSDEAFTAEGGSFIFVEESDVESAFPAEMPDWLAAITPSEGRAEETPGLDAGEIAPGALPSWVQAMRPVEAVIPEGGEATGEAEIVGEGPLAGLRSVLPAGPVFMPGRKPQSLGLKLQADEDQQANATLLQQMLEGEAEPMPLVSQPVLLSDRVMRWLLFLALVLAVGLPLLVRGAFTPQASLFPDGTLATMGVVNGLPENAAVLLVFDYEMALVGELEAVAAPVVDHLMLRGARLTMLSTTPGGPLLAERFLVRTQADHQYQPGSQYVNLGYLPGGAAGVLSFAQSPARSMPLSVEGGLAWETPVLQGVKGISDFDAVFVLSDNVEGARAWIEQAGPRLKNRPLVMVVSAQIEPVMRPYFDSGQVKGLIGGLEGGAAYEMVNSRPGLGRRYADSFSTGLFLTALAIMIGGVWSLVGFWRSRQQNNG